VAENFNIGFRFPVCDGGYGRQARTCGCDAPPGVVLIQGAPKHSAVVKLDFEVLFVGAEPKPPNGLTGKARPSLFDDGAPDRAPGQREVLGSQTGGRQGRDSE
jgi:hypothetical protein